MISVTAFDGAGGSLAAGNSGVSALACTGDAAVGNGSAGFVSGIAESFKASALVDGANGTLDGVAGVEFWPMSWSSSSEPSSPDPSRKVQRTKTRT